MFTFCRITVLMDYLFIYLDHIKVKDMLKKKTPVPVKLFLFYFVLNTYFEYYLVLTLFISSLNFKFTQKVKCYLIMIESFILK